MITEMQKAHFRVYLAMNHLIKVWNEDEVKAYPSYLPSFDEFASEFCDLMGKTRTWTYEEMIETLQEDNDYLNK